MVVSTKNFTSIKSINKTLRRTKVATQCFIYYNACSPSWYFEKSFKELMFS